jgi:hypothetical protein
MPNPNYEGKAFTVYIRDPNELEALGERAKKANMNKSAYILECVRRVHEFELDRLETDSDMLMDSLERYGKQIEKANEILTNKEEQLKRCTDQLAEISAERERVLMTCRDLIRLFRGGGYYSAQKVVEALGVDIKNPEAMRVVRQALFDLRDMGLVDENTRGWHWVVDFKTPVKNRL